MTVLRDLFWGEKAYLTYWYAFLLSFAFTWRKVLIPNVSGKDFNEYLDISFYVSDIFLLAAIIIILKHKYNYKSIYRVFHVEHWSIPVLLFYTLFNFFLAVDSWLWLDSFASILRIIATGIVFYTVLNLESHGNCSTWNNLRMSVIIIAFSAVFQIFVGSWQFFENHSIGLRLFNESILSQDMPGVAKVWLGSERQIRAYGTFLHPNILAGYLVFAILSLFIYLKLFHVEQSKSLSYKRLFHVEQLIVYPCLLSAFIGLFLAFSKSAIIALIVSLSVYLFHVEQSKSLSYKRLFHVEQFLFISSLLIFAAFIFIQGDQLHQSINERRSLVNQYDYPWIFGHGLGNGVFSITDKNLELWQLQPIHNIYLLVTSEVGIIGILLIFIFGINWFRKNVPRGTNTLSLLPLLTVLVIGIFDHYHWTIYTGQVLLGLSIGWAAYGVSRSVTIDKLV